MSEDMTARGPDDIPEIPARRIRPADLADSPNALMLAHGATGPRVALRADDILSGRVWTLEPIDDFPHFERDMRRLFEHSIWRRPGMALSPAETATLVPVARMLAATERWITGAFTSTGLPTEMRSEARESNLGHVVGMLDIVDAFYDDFLLLLRDAESIRELVRMIIGHDLSEFPRGDHSRSESTGLTETERLRAAWQKHQEEIEAVDMLVGRTRATGFAVKVRSILERYDAGKPKRYTMDTAHRGDIMSFTTKFIDLCQGTEHGCERIFVHYAPTDDGRLNLHLKEGVDELRTIGSKLMRLVAHRSPEHTGLAAKLLCSIAEPSIARSQEIAGGIP